MPDRQPLDEIANVPAEYDDLTKIHIGMPLPMQVVGVLSGVIEKLWPGAKLLPAKRGMVIGIDLKPSREIGETELEQLLADTEDDGLMVEHFSPAGARLRPYERIALVLADALRPAMGPQAINYVEIPLMNEMIVTVHRQEGLSPHHLRQMAEDRVAVLEQQLRDAGIEPAEPPALEWEQLRADAAWLANVVAMAEQLTGKDQTAGYAAIRDVLAGLPEARRQKLAAERYGPLATSLTPKIRKRLKLETP